MKSTTLTLRLSTWTFCTVLTAAWSVTQRFPVLEHDNVTLNCTAEHRKWIPGQRVNWYHNRLTHIHRYEGQRVQYGFGRWAGRTSSDSPFQLTIRDVGESDDGYYTCTIGFPSRGVRTVRSAVDVAVPVTGLEILPNNRTFTEGTVANISCVANGGKPTPYLRWSNNSESKPTTQNHHIQQMVNLTAEDNQRQLVCEEEQPHPLLRGYPIQQTAILNVMYRPRVTLEIEQGMNITIRCTVNANPPPTSIELTKENDILTVARETESYVEYSKVHVDKSDAGAYQCTAVNLVGRNVTSVQLDYVCSSSDGCGLVIRPTEPDSTSRDTDDERIGIYIVIPLSILVLVLSAIMAASVVTKRARCDDKVSQNRFCTDISSEYKTLVCIDDATSSPRQQDRFIKVKLINDINDNNATV